MRALIVLLGLLIIFNAAPAEAVPFEKTGAPASLADWVPWVLYGNETELCPAASEGLKGCVLPISLKIEVGRAGGSFEGIWEIRAEQAVTIPGQDGRWPIEVTGSRNGEAPEPLAVLGSGTPSVWLTPGRHTVTGQWSWNSLPETLTLPLGPVLSVYIEGRQSGFPALEENYAQGLVRLWLKDRIQTPQPISQQSPPVEEDRFLRVRLDRLVVDSQPMSVRTRVRLSAGGLAREELIDSLLPEGAKPVSLESALPARLTAEGLRVQVVAGVHDIFINSYQQGPVSTLGPVGDKYGQESWSFVAQPHLRQVEISGAPQIDRSLVNVDWLTMPVMAVAPDTNPNLWRAPLANYTVYDMNPGASLFFDEIRRGDPEPGPDRLSLNRTCWLDYDGVGLTCRDSLTGLISRQWYLSAVKPFVLGQASVNGIPQVITWQTDSQGNSSPGLQLRQGQLNLTADLRIENFDRTLLASGWDHDLDTTVQALILPPGYEVFHVSGAKALGTFSLPASWWDRWNTLDMFVVLAVVLSVGKLLGAPFAFLALLTMGLSYQEFMAPRLVFLHVLGASALLLVLPERGKARFLTRSWLILSSIALILMTASFLIYQARIAIYPQLKDYYQEDYRGLGYPLSQSFYKRSMGFGPSSSPSYAIGQESYYESYDADGYSELMPMAPPLALPEESSGLIAAAPPRAMKSNALAMSKSQAASIANSMLPEAKAQNTLSRPSWEFRTIYLNYNGQVTAEQTAKLYLIAPTLFSSLCFFRLLLMSLFVIVILSSAGAFKLPGPLSRLTPKSKAKRNPGPSELHVPSSALEASRPDACSDSASSGKAPALIRAVGTVGTFVISSLMLIFLSAAPAIADSLPSLEILDELKDRLLAKEKFPTPGFPELSLSGEKPDLITLTLTVEAAEETLIPLPLPDSKIFWPVGIHLADGNQLPLLTNIDGQRLALVPQGRNQVIIDGRLAPVEGFQLRLGSFVPQKITISSLPNWSVQGLGPDGRPTSQAVFITTGLSVESEPDQPPATSQSEPPVVPGRSDFASGGHALTPFFAVQRVISLGIDWKVYTTVTHYGPLASQVSLTVPLLEGESPTTPGLAVSGRRVVLNFSDNQTQRQFESDLVKNLDQPLILTASEGSFSESWTLDASAIWRVETSGLPPIHNLSPSGLFNPEWRPWPKETLSIKVTKPEPVPGEYLVVDGAKLTVNIGEENRRNELSISLRSSSGGTHTIFLPPGASLTSLELNNRSLPMEKAPAEGPVPVTIPLSPGLHKVNLLWLDQIPISAVTKTPVIDLKLASANINYNIVLPPDRWTLLAGGPIQGPAVLFWSFSGAILILAFLLGRLGLTPLKTCSWFLLLVGLSQLNVIAAFLVAGWLLALGLRGSRQTISGPTLFNFVQFVLVVWTITAFTLIYLGLQQALLAAPAMRITGYGSMDHLLKWFVDRTAGPLPEAWTLTISNKIYQYIMLAWALWLAISIIRWLKWAWNSFSAETFWKKRPPRPKQPRRRSVAGPAAAAAETAAPASNNNSEPQSVSGHNIAPAEDPS
jgi:hypothetical protein